MEHTYVEADFERAAAVVAAEVSPRELVQRLGVDWEFLTWLGLGLANEVSPVEAVTSAVEAFNAGFLLGAYLRRGSLDAAVEVEDTRLPWAVDEVHRRGRHAVIAEHCDLGAVARIEEAYAGALAESLGLPENDEIRGAVTRLFESGLATGLIVCDA